MEVGGCLCVSSCFYLKQGKEDFSSYTLRAALPGKRDVRLNLQVSRTPSSALISKFSSALQDSESHYLQSHTNLWNSTGSDSAAAPGMGRLPAVGTHTQNILEPRGGASSLAWKRETEK